jgi:outer membrane receptor protein involved in Fe transport
VHTFGPSWINDLRGGFVELYNTRISKCRDITNSSLGINNPLEFGVGGVAALMPTIDINTQRSTSGIGNAWDFYDRQRNAYLMNTVTAIRGTHSFQFGAEVRHTTLAGEYMARTNGDLDYQNWALFFTGHGASGGGSDLDQGDTRRNYLTWDTSFFLQDDWKVRKDLTLNFGVRWDNFGRFKEINGRIGTYFKKDMAARAGVSEGYHIASGHLIFKPNFDPLKMGLCISPDVPLDLSMVHKAQRDTIFQPDRNNFAPRVGIPWQPRGVERLVVRAGYGIYYERPTGAFKRFLST